MYSKQLCVVFVSLLFGYNLRLLQTYLGYISLLYLHEVADVLAVRQDLTEALGAENVS